MSRFNSHGGGVVYNIGPSTFKLRNLEKVKLIKKKNKIQDKVETPTLGDV